MFIFIFARNFTHYVTLNDNTLRGARYDISSHFCATAITDLSMQLEEARKKGRDKEEKCHLIHNHPEGFHSPTLPFPQHRLQVCRNCVRLCPTRSPCCFCIIARNKVTADNTSILYTALRITYTECRALSQRMLYLICGLVLKVCMSIRVNLYCCRQVYMDNSFSN